jgi:uncharacterized protein (UPF0332 family)
MGGDYFGCRECYELTYASRNKKRSGLFASFGGVFDAEDKLDKIYKKKFNSFYRGQPTKTQRRIDKIEQERMYSYRDLLIQHKGILKGRGGANKIK